MKALTFITGNKNKAEQLERYLAFPVTHKKLDLPEIQSLDVCEVATQKATTAYEMLGSAVLVEDTALIFNALNGLPGPLIKWFLEQLGTDGLCKSLAAYEDRSAVAKTCFALCDETGVHLFTGERAGTVAIEPKGSETFGWNPVFIPAGEKITWAEMDDIDVDLSRKTSMRRLALEKLQQYLESHYK